MEIEEKVMKMLHILCCCNSWNKLVFLVHVIAVSRQWSATKFVSQYTVTPIGNFEL